MNVNFYYFSCRNLRLLSSSCHPFFPIFNYRFEKSSTSVLVIILFIVIVGLSLASCSFSELFFLNIFLRWLGDLGTNVNSLLINGLGVGFSGERNRGLLGGQSKHVFFKQEFKFGWKFQHFKQIFISFNKSF